MRSEMLRAQQRHQDPANARRLPEPIFKIRDIVWLDAKNITTQRPSRKLDHKRLGLFPIEEILPPNSYRLTLPDTMHNHPVYHVSLLERVAENPYPGQLVPPPSPVIVNDEEEFVVEEILDARLFGRGKKLKYLVKWMGYADPDWQDAEAVNKLQAVDEFHQRYPHKPGPLAENVA